MYRYDFFVNFKGFIKLIGLFAKTFGSIVQHSDPEKIQVWIAACHTSVFPRSSGFKTERAVFFCLYLAHQFDQAVVIGTNPHIRTAVPCIPCYQEQCRCLILTKKQQKNHQMFSCFISAILNSYKMFC